MSTTPSPHPFARRSLSEPGPLGRGDAEEPAAVAAGAPSRDHAPVAAASACPFARTEPGSQATTCPFSGSTATTTEQRPWQARLRRPTADAGAARLSRRALRAQNRAFSLEEVSRHRYADDGWIAVNGRVYDITEHVLSHKGWDSGCGMTEVLSILAHLGTDCTREFDEIHACYPVAFAQLRAYDIGPLETAM